MRFALLCLASIAASPPAQNLPARLNAGLQGWSARTAEVEWTLAWYGGNDNGLVERHVTRMTPDALWESNLGDVDGFHFMRFRKSPPDNPTPEELEQCRVPKEEDAGARNRLLYEGRAYYLEKPDRPQIGYSTGVESSSSWRPVDFRSFGLNPYLTTQMPTNPFHLHEAAWEGFETAAFREGREGSYPTVTAEWAEGRHQLTWRFDDRRGGLPVRASYYRDGEPVYHSETDYQKIGERWFPKSMRFYARNPPVLQKAIDVRKATVDEPWHMQEITPTDIGLVAGTHLITPEGAQYWTGADMIPMDDFWPMVWLDDSILDQRIAELMVEGTNQTVDEYRERLRRAGIGWRKEYRKTYGEDPVLAPLRPGEKDEWDVYVEKFIAEHKLPEPAVQKAHETRDRAKKLRDANRLKNRAPMREAKRKGDHKRLAELEKLETRIFERMLERPLQRMLKVLEKQRAEDSAAKTPLPDDD